MNQPNFTPGPWRTAFDPTQIIAGDRDLGRRVAGTYGDDAEATANARLIAAAPALYEAIEDMLTTARDTGFDSWPGDAGAEFTAACERVRAALALVDEQEVQS